MIERIATQVYKGGGNFVKQAYIIRYFCANKDACELYQQGECFCNRNLLLGSLNNDCPYSSVEYVGVSPKAQAYRQFMAQAEYELRQFPKMTRLGDKDFRRVAKIGEYFWLPFLFIAVGDAKKFPAPAFWIGRNHEENFLRQTAATPPIIQTILDYRPIALNGEEIFQYQRDDVPKLRAEFQRLGLI